MTTDPKIKTDPITAAINRAIALLNSAKLNQPLASRFAEDAIAELTATKPAALLKPPVTNKPTVALIVGHDATAKGAYSSTLALSEYDYWRSVASKIANMRSLLFNPVIIMRDNIGISGAYAQADRLKPSLVVELHFNASTEKSAKGFEILYAAGARRSHIAASAMGIAWSDKNPLSVLRQNGTGLLPVTMKDRGGFNLHCLLSPSVLIEPFFGSNVVESKRHSDRDAMATNVIHMVNAALTVLKPK